LEKEWQAKYEELVQRHDRMIKEKEREMKEEENGKIKECSQRYLHEIGKLKEQIEKSDYELDTLNKVY
jgi:hypothetical protein